MSKDRSSIGSILRGWLDKLMPACNEPENLDELVQLLKSARDSHLMDSEALSMMEGVLQVSDLRVRDIMVPRAHMVVVYRDDPLDQILPTVVESSHSRFPVIDDDKAEVLGIMLAKDLLQFCGNADMRFNIREVLRPTLFVPESKRLNVLLKELRASRNHMAIVIDEYGNAAGFVTIEDVIEQIVGEIEDEHDFDEGAYILKRSENSFTVKAHTRMEDFNAYFECELSSESIDTIGGKVIGAFGYVPKRNESVEIEGFKIKVLRSDSRKVHLLSVERMPDEESESTTEG